MNAQLPLPCPFCGAEAVGRMDGANQAKPFFIRCTRVSCPGHNTAQGYADPEVALTEWNRRVQVPPANPVREAEVYGFTKKSLIRGELVTFTLDRTGVIQSDQIAFSPWSEPLMKKPRE